MLSVYTRHSQKCPHRDDIAWRRCRCPKWIQGNVRTAFRRRKCAQRDFGLVRNWLVSSDDLGLFP